MGGVGPVQPPPSEPFDSALIQPHVDDFVVGKLRRREQQARLIAEYEAEHGVITQAEMDALWPDGNAASTQGGL